MGGEAHINMVSYGGGVNSTALLVGLHQHRIPVDLILFADTGAEHPHTYAYLDIMDRWLKDHGMPPITRVYKTTRDGKRLTLEQECLQSGTLPSMAYGFKRCSLKHKIGPQEKFCNHYPPCRKVWAAGKRVVKFIGYDAGEGYRSDKVLLGDLADPKYSKWYPLMERTVWKGELHTWQLLRKSAETSKRPRRRSLSSRSASALWRRSL